jgi:hypothetical protein
LSTGDKTPEEKYVLVFLFFQPTKLYQLLTTFTTKLFWPWPERLGQKVMDAVDPRVGPKKCLTRPDQLGLLSRIITRD